MIKKHTNDNKIDINTFIMIFSNSKLILRFLKNDLNPVDPRTTPYHSS